MGESKRRKQILGSRYGIPSIDEQVLESWEIINVNVVRAKCQGADTLLCLCSRNNFGYSLEAIQKMRSELENWQCPLHIPVSIQMLPQGFRISETKLFDGFMTVWCNSPNHPFWKELFEIKV